MLQLFSKAFLWYSININKVLFFTFYTLLAILFVERFLIIFSYEAHTAGIDNNFDYPIIRSLAGYSMYPNPDDYPYAVNPYAPLFFIICKSAAVLLNVSATDTISIYRISRSVSLLADTGTCLLLFTALSRQLHVSKALSVAATALFFSILCYLGYTINRSDSLFLFFYVLTVFVLLKTPPGKNFWTAFISAALTTLCIFSKQNGISLLLLLPAWFILDRNYRSLVQFIFFVMVFCCGLYVYFDFFYTNHSFSLHVINALKNKIDIRWFYVYVIKLMSDSFLILPIAVSLVISAKSIAENKGPLIKKLGTMVILQFIFSTALCLKWGSSRGYYNESFLLGFILIPLFYKNITTTTISAFVNTVSIYTYPALFIFIVHITAQLFFFFINSQSEAKEKFNEQVQIANYIKKEITTENQYVLDLSNPDFNFFKNLLFKESAAPNMDIVNCCTLPDNIFNYNKLTDGLKTGKITFLIENKAASEKVQWGVNLQHYKLDTSFSTYSIYRFNSSIKD